jgi:hypothetical protein
MKARVCRIFADSTGHVKLAESFRLGQAVSLPVEVWLLRPFWQPCVIADGVAAGIEPQQNSLAFPDQTHKTKKSCWHLTARRRFQGVHMLSIMAAKAAGGVAVAEIIRWRWRDATGNLYLGHY